MIQVICDRCGGTIFDDDEESREIDMQEISDRGEPMGTLESLGTYCGPCVRLVRELVKIETVEDATRDQVLKEIAAEAELPAQIQRASRAARANGEDDAGSPADDDSGGSAPVLPPPRLVRGADGATRRKPPRGLDFDAKVRLRQKHAEAMAGRQRAPNGFLEQMAVEFDCSVATVKNVIYHQDGT